VVSVTSHHHRAGNRSVACAVLTVSDTRSLDTDVSGARICELLVAGGHTVAVRDILPDDPEPLRGRVAGLVSDALEAVIITGGTGLAPRDNTYEVVAELLDKRIDGFGELFRSLSFAEIGPVAMLSRAVAGAAGRTVVVALPGSTNAVDLAMGRLLLPVLGHMVALVRG
jgi:molybdenum cofactor biosynthesis protein B